MPVRKYRKRTYRYTTKYRRRSKKIKKIKKLVRIVTFSLLGLLLSSVSFYLYTLTINLKKPFASASNGIDFNSNFYNSSKPFNVILIHVSDTRDLHSDIKQLYLFRIEPGNKKVLLVKIPVETQTYLNKTIGNGYVSKLYSLGNYSNNKLGVQYIVNFIKKTLAINVDAYVVYDDQAINKFKDININVSSKDLPKSIKYSYFLKIGDLFNISRQNLLSDLNSVEMFKILSDTKSVSLPNYIYKELTPKELSSPKEFDFFWQNNTENKDIFYERLLVTVLNSTDTPGLAGWGSRVIKNAGANILEIGNYEEPLDSTVIYTDVNDNSALLKYLVTFYDVDLIYKPSDFKKDPFLAKRSDILLIIGKKEALDY